MKLPDEPTTTEQWQVIAWGVVMVLVILGSVAICGSFGAPAARADLARQIRGYGLELWALAVAAYCVKRLIERFVS